MRVNGFTAADGMLRENRIRAQPNGVSQSRKETNMFVRQLLCVVFAITLITVAAGSISSIPTQTATAAQHGH